MWKQVEILEDHADLTADSVDTAHAGMHPRAVDHDIALLMFLELVEATNQRRFSGARRTTDDYPLAPRYREINVSQRLEATKELVHVAHRDDLTTDFMVRSGNFGFCGHGISVLE